MCSTQSMIFWPLQSVHFFVSTWSVDFFPGYFLWPNVDIKSLTQLITHNFSSYFSLGSTWVKNRKERIVRTSKHDQVKEKTRSNIKEIKRRVRQHCTNNFCRSITKQLPHRPASFDHRSFSLSHSKYAFLQCWLFYCSLVLHKFAIYFRYSIFSWKISKNVWVKCQLDVWCRPFAAIDRLKNKLSKE